MRHIFFGRQLPTSLCLVVGLSEPGDGGVFIDGQQPGGGQAGGGAPPAPVPFQPVLPSPAELGVPAGSASPAGGQQPAPNAPAPAPAAPQLGQPPAAAPRTYSLTEDDIQRLITGGVQQFVQRQQAAPGAPGPTTPPAPPAVAQQPTPNPPPPQAPTTPPAQDPAQEARNSRLHELERELKALKEEQQRTQKEKEQLAQQAGAARVQQVVLGELVGADVGLSQIAANKAYAELQATGRIRPHTDGQVYVVLSDENGVERTHYLRDGLKKWAQTNDGLFYKGAVPAGAGSTPSSIGAMPNLAGGPNSATPEYASSAAAAARNLEHDLRLSGQLPPGPRG